MTEEKENMKELREEIDELKNIIKDLAKNQANAYKNLDEKEKTTKLESEKKQDKLVEILNKAEKIPAC